MRDEPLELSWVTIMRPRERLLAYCRAFYPYYDGLPVTNPFRIEPLDVVAIAAMTKFMPWRADGVGAHEVHVGLAIGCNPVLESIPPDADLRSFDPSLAIVRELLASADVVEGVGIAVATKVLHRKRRFLIPILDSRLLDLYAPNPAKNEVSRAIAALEAFRGDLRARYGHVSRGAGASAGWTPTRRWWRIWSGWSTR